MKSKLICAVTALVLLTTAVAYAYVTWDAARHQRTLDLKIAITASHEAFYLATRLNERIDREYNQLVNIAERRDELTKQLDAGNITDVERQKLKEQCAQYQLQVEERLAQLEKDLKFFEGQLTACRAELKRLKLDRKIIREDRALESMIEAELLMPKLKYRLSRMKDSWSQYKKGDPLPDKI